MNFWNSHDLAVVDLREKIIFFTEEFENKYGKDIPEYHNKLERFLQARLKKQSRLILNASVLMTTRSLIFQNQKV